jgi:hypothetical protein
MSARSDNPPSIEELRLKHLSWRRMVAHFNE